ncbi:MAG: acyl-[Lachnospiraceae bacterium]|nr:acyl-[acyl-carrier-protein] thioesterase [Lachnospiraceae bacterium]
MYSFDGRIRYSEVDRSRRLTVEKTIDYFQDCSSFQSEDLGVGLDYMERNKIAWVVNYWQIRFLRRPCMGESVRTGTAPYEFKGIMGMRNFMMETPEGERLAAANSVWTLLDLEKMYPMRIPAELKDKYKLCPKLEMDYKPRKIAVPGGGGERMQELEVKFHHLDTNRHMNNAQYVHFAAMYLPADSEVKELRVEYRRQALLGDRIEPVLYHIGDKILLTSLNGEDGRPYAVVEMTLQ